MGFWNALSALAPIAPAIAEAREIRTARQQQAKQFEQESALRDAQLTAQKLAAQAEQQRLGAPVFLPNSAPYYSPTAGKLVQNALVNGALQAVPVPGLTPEEEEKQREKDALSAARGYEDALKALGRPADPEGAQRIYLERMGVKPFAELTPYQTLEFNQPKLTMTGGLPVVAFQGKTFTESDLKDQSLPAEVRKLLESGEAAVKQKQDQEDRRQQAAADRLAATLEHQSEMQTQRVIDALHTNDYEKAQTEVRKVQGSYDLSRNLLARMQAAQQKANAGDQQAMFSILANHIVMTTRQQGSSMRPSKPLFDEAVSSLPAADSLMKRFDQNKGVLLGIVLTPDQIQQMVGLAQERVQSDQKTLNDVKQEYATSLGWGQRMEGGGARSKGKGKGEPWSPPADAPPAPVQDGKLLKSNGQVIARSQGGKWVEP